MLGSKSVMIYGGSKVRLINSLYCSSLLGLNFFRRSSCLLIHTDNKGIVSIIAETSHSDVIEIIVSKSLLLKAVDEEYIAISISTMYYSKSSAIW
jgi:hypothetical protein